MDDPALAGNPHFGFGRFGVNWVSFDFPLNAVITSFALNAVPPRLRLTDCQRRGFVRRGPRAVRDRWPVREVRLCLAAITVTDEGEVREDMAIPVPPKPVRPWITVGGGAAPAFLALNSG